MKVEISMVRNGFLLKLDPGPSARDPLGQGNDAGTWFCRDTTDLLGRIAKSVKEWGDPIQDQLDRD